MKTTSYKRNAVATCLMLTIWGTSPVVAGSVVSIVEPKSIPQEALQNLSKAFASIIIKYSNTDEALREILSDIGVLSEEDYTELAKGFLHFIDSITDDITDKDLKIAELEDFLSHEIDSPDVRQAICNAYKSFLQTEEEQAGNS